MAPIADMLQEHVDSGALPGAVALSCRRGRTDTAVVGNQDLESKIPMSARTLFHWDSLSKPLTAALALTFVSDGSIDIDSPIDRWLPELSGPRVLEDPSGPLTATTPAARPVTLEDLLTLRGGLGFTTDFESDFTAALVAELQEGPAPRSLDRESFLTSAGKLPLAHQPGQGWTYNTGSTILGLLLERLADRPLDDLMTKRLVEPLEMTDARWWVPPSDLHRFTARYERTDDPREKLRLVDPAEGRHAHPPTFPDGAGGMIGTADDWLSFGRMLLDGGVHQGRRILPDPLVTSIMTDHLTAAQRDQAGFFLDDGEGWGYGGSVRTDGTYGWAGGAGTIARIDPRRDQVSVLMTQVALDDPQGSPLLTSFEHIARGEDG